MLNIRPTSVFDQISYNYGGQNITKKVIKNTQVNHDLLTSLYTADQDDRKITIDQMTIGQLTEEELTALSEIGFMQFDDKNTRPDIFEYSADLDDVTISSIVVPKTVDEITFSNLEIGNTQTLSLALKYINYDKLIVMFSSNDTVVNLSELIHNYMENPHINIRHEILYKSDEKNIVVMSLVSDDLIYKLSNTKLGDDLIEYGDAGDTNSGYAVYDAYGNDYVFIINQLAVK